MQLRTTDDAGFARAAAAGRMSFLPPFNLPDTAGASARYFAAVRLPPSMSSHYHDWPNCDAYGNISTSGFGFTFIASALQNTRALYLAEPVPVAQPSRVA